MSVMNDMEEEMYQLRITIDNLKQQRDELLAILQDLREWNGDLVLRDYIDAAIAKDKK